MNISMLIMSQEEKMDNPIGYVIKELQAVLRARMDRALKTCGLTTPQYASLYSLERNPGISNAELARKCFVTPQTMIRIVANLEAAGLIARSPHPTHGRILHTTLTARGRKLFATCHESAMEIENQMLQPLSTQERKQLRELLRRCTQSLAG
jgi:DNA-binding MarR family transcriptional regulator